jgi:bleomycin hydrolase
MPTEITEGVLQRLDTAYSAPGPRGALANAIARNSLRSLAVKQEPLRATQHTFSLELQTGKMTAQNSSGRCWLFAGLNVLRFATMKKLNLETFEFSQNYQMFWDKLEKVNFFLESILRTLDEPTEGRLVNWLLGAPLNDGGQWDMFVNLVDKYGVVPKYSMPETYHSSNTGEMNWLLTMRLHEDAARLRNAYRLEGLSLAALRERKEAMLAEAYRMLCECLGEPPKRVDLECRDKDGKYIQHLGLTPLEFAERFVPVAAHDYVSLIHAPTADKPFDRTYTVKFLGNVEGGRQVLYLNVVMPTLKRLALAQLQDGEPVWFGCDVGKMMDRETGVLDARLYDFGALLGMEFGLDKAERLDYRESVMTHAMVFQGVNLVDGVPNRWKVENSWSEKAGKDGYFVMSDEWFNEYLYQVVVHKKYLSPAMLTALAQEPIQLEPWDPMGSLAR